MTPVPTTYHQRILGKLFRLISAYTETYNLGEAMIAPVDLVLSMTDVVQPDLIYIAKERSRIITKKNIVEAPDLVVEIISESTEAIDRSQKKQLYEKYGVKEYWIIDPEEMQIELFLLTGNTYELKETFTRSDKLTSKVIDGFSTQFKEIF